MVSRFLRLRFIGKRRKSVGFPVIDAMLWSPLNQISTQDCPLILHLEVNWFKSHWCFQVCFRTLLCYIDTHVFLINWHIIMCIEVSTRPKKHHPSFLPSPLLKSNQSGNLPPHLFIGFLVNPILSFKSN